MRVVGNSFYNSEFFHYVNSHKTAIISTIALAALLAFSLTFTVGSSAKIEILHGVESFKNDFFYYNILPQGGCLLLGICLILHIAKEYFSSGQHKKKEMHKETIRIIPMRPLTKTPVAESGKTTQLEIGPSHTEKSSIPDRSQAKTSVAEAAKTAELAVVPSYIEKSSIPGQCIMFFVKEGDNVEKGSPLFITSSMKMEWTYRAMHSGKVTKIYTQVGQIINANEPILEIS